ncbi:DNA-directed RNA polymerase III subunit RPC7-like [Microplitis mediator]|uniref:DNA-directed RNA polymerase III subunit RPC7-like n=1 Tax=Microplitis mediator TaxID=375433 RepID=UPI002552AAB0|nr:DNA-directed RNA polymerase III subunit RPC7-like [Microplitis mediator]
MSGRGRGRGGGGGRGGRNAVSDPTVANQKQEEKMKIVTQPPPIYPPLENKAPKPQITAEWSYLCELRRDFAESLHESINNVEIIAVKKDIERYSDRYADILTNKSRYDEFCDWSIMPRELKPVEKKRKAADPVQDVKAKKVKEIKIDEKLAKLEALEESKKDNDDEEEKAKSGDEDDEEEKDAEEDLEDEEMDDGTDYANNYFDNGEGYDDEDDNLDDGAVFN